MIQNGAKHVVSTATGLAEIAALQGKLSPIAGSGFQRGPVSAGVGRLGGSCEIPTDSLVAEEETLGGREGGRWAAQRRPLGGREAGASGGSPRGSWILPLRGTDFPLPWGGSMGGGPR